MSWAEHVIWWHVYPLGFVRAEREAAQHTPADGGVTHRLPQLLGWLEHLIELGCNGLLLAPVFASRSHGYDTLDHFRLDPRLGDDSDLDRLISECHSRGIRVLLDGVFNHVSRDHEIVQRALAAQPGSPERAWVRWSGDYLYCFEGHEDLVELDLRHPPVQDYVVSVMTHWLERGIDGWRLDAAYAPGPEVWRPITDRVHAAHPDCWILAEVIHGDYTDFVARSGVDSVTQYELWKAIWSSLNDVNLHELAWAIKRHNDFCSTFRPQTFIGNHDVTRVATRLDDIRQLPLAVALAMLVPGVPSVYAGDEHAFTGEKLDQPGGDEPVRPPFPETPEGLAPYGQPTFEMYRDTIGERRRRPWLGGASIRPVEVTNETLTAELTAGSERVTLALNASDKPVTLPGTHGALTVGPHGWALG